MKLSGNRQLNAPLTDVWAKLNDVDVLRRCIPGCEKLEKLSDTDLTAVAALKIGPMNVRFTGDVTLSDLQPPHSYRISGSGKAGPAGMASGGANVTLEAKDGGTLLTYDVDANVSGKIAQLGQRLIDATAAQLAEKFFTGFAAEVEPNAGAAAMAPTVAVTAAAATAATTAVAGGSPATSASTTRPANPGTTQPAARGTGIPAWLWGVGAALVLAILYVMLKR
jgi:uncharacterized protein